jgi:hypothetical protein
MQTVAGEIKKVEPHLRAIATRMNLADKSLVETLMTFGTIGREDAVLAAGQYKKHKIVTLDLTNQTYNVKHGAFLEAVVIANAVAQAKEPKKAKKMRR